MILYMTNNTPLIHTHKPTHTYLYPPPKHTHTHTGALRRGGIQEPLSEVLQRERLVRVHAGEYVCVCMYVYMCVCMYPCLCVFVHV